MPGIFAFQKPNISVLLKLRKDRRRAIDCLKFFFGAHKLVERSRAKRLVKRAMSIAIAVLQLSRGTLARYLVIDL